MAAALNITDQDVFTVLSVFLKSFLPSGTEVVQGQDNRVAMPLGEFVAMTNAHMTRLSTVINQYAGAPVTKALLAPTKYEIQLDFYGPSSQSWAVETQSLFRDFYATDMMPANVQPLFADDPVQIPLLDSESQYEQRWKLTTTLQYNPVVTVSQDYFATVDITLKEVDTSFPP